MECPICYEVKKLIKHENCEHYTCVKCFNYFYCNSYNVNKPIFPYSDDINKRHIENRDNMKIRIEFPLVRKYYEDLKKWEEQSQPTCSVCFK